MRVKYATENSNELGRGGGSEYRELATLHFAGICWLFSAQIGCVFTRGWGRRSDRRRPERESRTCRWHRVPYRGRGRHDLCHRGRHCRDGHRDRHRDHRDHHGASRSGRRFQ